jgi:hypothetical protein
LIIVVIAFFTLKTTAGNPITESQAKQIAYATLSKRIGTSHEIPIGSTIKNSIICKRRELDGKLWKWEVGMQIQLPDYRIKQFRVDIEPYSGDIIGIIPFPTGYTGTESPDIKHIFIQGWSGNAPTQPQMI